MSIIVPKYQNTVASLADCVPITTFRKYYNESVIYKICQHEKPWKTKPDKITISLKMYKVYNRGTLLFLANDPQTENFTEFTNFHFYKHMLRIYHLALKTLLNTFRMPLKPFPLDITLVSIHVAVSALYTNILHFKIKNIFRNTPLMAQYPQTFWKTTDI